MVGTKELTIGKAYTELNEVIKRLSPNELSKIPHQVIENIKENIDNEYIWEYNDSKKIEEQDFMAETKALIVEMYERYLCPDDKKEFWQKYDRICLNMIEQKKSEEYNPDSLFNKKDNSKGVSSTDIEIEKKDLIPYENTTWYMKIFQSVSMFFKKIFNKR